MIIEPVIAQDVIRYFGFVRFLTNLQGMRTEYEQNEEGARFRKQYLEQLRKQSMRGKRFQEEHASLLAQYKLEKVSFDHPDLAAAE
jgi:uncharacterized protein YfbU (UPF0304 family)